jgi:hypothetical protein
LRWYLEPSCLLGLANSHLLFKSCAEGLEIRFEKPNVAAHHAEMGNLLSLYSKIHRLRADAKENRSFPHADGQFVHDRAGWRFDCRFREILMAPSVAPLKY